MANKNTNLVITEESLNSMINACDFSGVGGNIPELVAYLLQSAPTLMQCAFKEVQHNG